MSHKGEGDLKEGSDKDSHRMGYQEKNMLAAVLKAEETLSWMIQPSFFQKYSKSSVQRCFKREAESIQMETRKELGRGALCSICKWFIW